MAKLFLIIASISGFLAVAIGAFGAHGLKQKISVDLMAAYQIGVQYHFYHTLALLGVGILLQQFPQSMAFKVSGWMLLLGIVGNKLASQMRSQTTSAPRGLREPAYGPASRAR